MDSAKTISDDGVRMREVCRMISDDMVADTEKMEGAPFNGRNVAEGFGEVRAAIKALAEMLEVVIETLTPPPE